MIVDVDPGTTQTCFDLRKGAGRYPLRDCRDVTTLRIRLKKRCGATGAPIEYPATAVLDGRVCFAWDVRLYGAPAGRYAAEIYDGAVRVACAQIQLDNRTRSAGAQNYCADPCA